MCLFFIAITNQVVLFVGVDELATVMMILYLCRYIGS